MSLEPDAWSSQPLCRDVGPWSFQIPPEDWDTRLPRALLLFSLLPLCLCSFLFSALAPGPPLLPSSGPQGPCGKRVPSWVAGLGLRPVSPGSRAFGR